MRTLLKIASTCVWIHASAAFSMEIIEIGDFWRERPEYQYLYFSIDPQEMQPIYTLINQGWQIDLTGTPIEENIKIRMRLVAPHSISTPFNIVTDKTWFNRNSFGNHKNYSIRATNIELLSYISEKSRTGYNVAFYGYGSLLKPDEFKVAFVK